MQIEELTKELKRTQEECELIKYKLKGYKNKNTVNFQQKKHRNQSLQKKIIFFV